MRKKRGSPRERKAQITLFIVLGIIIFFTFLLLIQLSVSMHKTRFIMEQEGIVSKLFKREALRIFVEDCLQDELQDGLLLLGRQGKLWDDQPGGTKRFVEGQTGSWVGDDRVAYGITFDQEPYLAHPDAYPCADDADPSSYCRYHYPDTSYRFGTLDIRTDALKADLKRYAENRTVWCVQQFVHTNISSHAVLSSADLDLKLEIVDDGISVIADYPLRFSVGEEEFFHLSKFEFFYPTRLNQLLSAAVAKPLGFDYRYIDFEYTPETLAERTFLYGSPIGVNDQCSPEEDYFLCPLPLAAETYTSLAITMELQDLPSGDTLFMFQPSPYTLVNDPTPYIFQFVRQNRPPALDYVGRAECPSAGFDYLVIKDDPAFGEINITLSTNDPDEDTTTNYFTNAHFATAEASPAITFNVTADALRGLLAQWYNITAFARDEHGVEDWQTIRILLDRPLTMGISLRSPYADINYSLGGNRYVVSREDPVYLDITLPQETVSGYHEDVSLTYAVDGNTETFTTPIRSSSSPTEGCYLLPFTDQASSCDLSAYTENNFADIKSLPINPFKERTTPGQPGQLTLNLDINYCGNNPQHADATAEIIVAECVPHRNQSHPWGYNENYRYRYHTYEYGLKRDGTTDFDNFIGQDADADPFTVNHICCLGDPARPGSGRIAAAADHQPCFVNPQPDCYGRIQGYTLDVGVSNRGTLPETNADYFSGYIQEEQFVECASDPANPRGNTCEGERQYRPVTAGLICGNNTMQYCETIQTPCENQPAFGYVDANNDGNNDAWCHGTMGCSDLCSNQAGGAVVYISSGDPPEDMNGFARDNNITSNNEMGVDCGCTGHDNAPCDGDFDGIFEGTCVGGFCQ